MILAQLRSRQIAEEQVETYGRQEKAAVKERELREAEARARQQEQLTVSELSITIQGNQGKAEYQRALQQAAQVRALARADAERAARLGIGQAIAIEEQVRAYGGPQFQLTRELASRFAEAIEKSGVEVVPRIVMGNGKNGGGGGGALEGLLALLLSDRLGQRVERTVPGSRNPEAEVIREEVRRSLRPEEGPEKGPEEERAQ